MKIQPAAITMTCQNLTCANFASGISRPLSFLIQKNSSGRIRSAQKNMLTASKRLETCSWVNARLTGLNPWISTYTPLATRPRRPAMLKINNRMSRVRLETSLGCIEAPYCSWITMLINLSPAGRYLPG